MAPVGSMVSEEVLETVDGERISLILNIDQTMTLTFSSTIISFSAHLLNYTYDYTLHGNSF